MISKRDLNEIFDSKLHINNPLIVEEMILTSKIALLCYEISAVQEAYDEGSGSHGCISEKACRDRAAM